MVVGFTKRFSTLEEMRLDQGHNHDVTVSNRVYENIRMVMRNGGKFHVRCAVE